MNIARLFFAVMLCLSVVLVAAEDLTVIPGKKVGPITALSSLNTLQALFGKTHVKNGKIAGPEGTELDGATLFHGTDKELEIVWDEQSVGKRISAVRIIGKAWKFENGLKLGLTVPEVEKINGKSFKVGGFDWDYGGYGMFEQGKLADGVSIRFQPTEATYSSSIVGERQIDSTDKDLLAAQPVVAQIEVYFPGPY